MLYWYLGIHINFGTRTSVDIYNTTVCFVMFDLCVILQHFIIQVMIQVGKY